uniref:Doublecortin domain-containing protein n=1 Tax=Terrapene triunguis TaxID=2587831 RepID=A0A674JVF4_9SAUR
MTQAPADYLTTSSPYNDEQPLPAVARTNAITRVPPTKKITFFKSGDPQFGGVKMAINPRSFKSFNALMDDLSHRVPLPFGVRTITTPRGIHCISALDQLEDGGCYLCSDKKYVKPFSIGTGRRVGPQWNGRPASALRRGGQEGRREDHSRPFSQQGPKILKKITLVKNGDIGIRRSIILNHRNARSFKTLLDEISELLQFTVKKLYTVDGKKVSLCDTWCWLFIPQDVACPTKHLAWGKDSRQSHSEQLTCVNSIVLGFALGKVFVPGTAAPVQSLTTKTRGPSAGALGQINPPLKSGACLQLLESLKFPFPGMSHAMLRI